jgi:hypothetical protein
MADVACFYTKPRIAFRAKRGILTYKKGGLRIVHEGSRSGDLGVPTSRLSGPCQNGVGWLKCQAERYTISSRLAAEGNRP